MPSKFDLQIPKQHQDWLQHLSDELKLTNLPPKAIAIQLKTYFQQHFFYSLYLGNKTDADLALREFMLKRKAGHCEYFAIATVFLLRQSGIPARLANGYSVSEFDDQHQVYIVRRRHSHAWALAYIDGYWQAVDTTPSQWLTMEAQQASFWQPLLDTWSNWLFYFRQWQGLQNQQQNTKLGLLTALLLTLYLALRLYADRKKPSQNNQADKKTIVKASYQGQDSEFYLIEQDLKNTIAARQTNESIQHWVNRLQQPSLNQLAKLHYQLRFDPEGLTVEQRRQLQLQVSAWKYSNDS